MSTSSLISIDTIDLSQAAEQIRPTNEALADLLDAVDDVERDSLHTMVEWPNGETECNEDCAPCAAKYAAQVVAFKYLRSIAKQEAAR